MRVAVTGASGFLGSHLALGLRARGHEVVGIVRDLQRAQWLRTHDISLVRADLCDRASLISAFDGIDALISNAAPASDPTGSDVSAFIEADRRATENVVEAALAHKLSRLVHISSVSVYRVRWPCRMLAEDHPRRSSDDIDLIGLLTRRGYAQSKARSEEVIWSAIARGLRPTVLRPGPIYGSRDEKLTARYTRAFRSRVRLVPTVRIPHVHAGDVADAVCGALENEASVGRAYNITGQPHSLLEIARAAREVCGASTWLLPIPVPLWLGWDNRAAKRDLGVSYRPLCEGLQEALGRAR